MESTATPHPLARGRDKHHVQSGVLPNHSPQVDNDFEKSLRDSVLEPEKDTSSRKVSSSRRTGFKLPEYLQWIPTNWTWSKFKPVIRCAAAAWIATILFIIPQVQNFMGQASFLIIMVPFLSPPFEPFLAVMEREIITLLFVTTAWAWSCLGMRVADLLRVHRDPTVKLSSAITGQYIEAGPTVILAFFIFFGSVFFSYIRARQGIGPYFYGCFLGCLCLDVSLTTAVFFPFPFYMAGRTIVLPITLFSAIALLVSITIFPSTVSAQFTNRLQDVLSPLVESFEAHQHALKSEPHTEHFAEIVSSIKSFTSRSEANLTSLAASARLLNTDIIYSRYSPEDFHAFHNLARRITARTNGMETYFTLIDPVRDKFPVTPAPSVPATPAHSVPATPLPSTSPGSVSRMHSPEYVNESQFNGTDDSYFTIPTHHRALHASSSNETPAHSSLHRRSRGVHSPRLNIHRPLPYRVLHRKLLAHSRQEVAVGVFESQRYLNLEAANFHDPDAQTYTTQTTALLSDSCDELLGNCTTATAAVRDWLGGVRNGRLNFWISAVQRQAQRTKRVTDLQHSRDELFSALENFRNEKRHKILDPYCGVFGPKVDPDTDQERPGHRYLFHCYTYQYHLIQVASIILEMLDETIKLEKERQRHKIWTQMIIFRWNIWEMPENAENDHDEDPDIIQGLSPEVMGYLGIPRRRDPDALPPRNTFESSMNLLYYAISSLRHGNFLFAFKAALVTVILCLPFFLKSSATYAYENRLIWIIFMGQLTLARFRGDTTFGLISRVLSTFAGGIVGMLVWYIASGSGTGNPYTFVVVCGVCYPFFFYARIYWTVPFMVNMVFFFTANLVLGYSWQDTHIPSPGSLGSGFSVAWRRFVLVTAGVTAAFIASFLPPTTTLRSYQRTTLATTSEEIGNIYCTILSFANSRRKEMIPEINTRLIAVRSKLRRSIVLNTNVIYEFSLKGRWPAERYQSVLNLQFQLTYGLSDLFSVIENLEPSWTRALLRRNRFLDSDFQGDILAVIAMISFALRTGYPLPQITPCPLLDRSMSIYQGLEVIRKDAEEDYGLPRTLNLDTLRDEQYLMFCVGVSTSFSIMTRLDRLMVATKEVVGEQFHIHGVDLAPSASRV